MRVRQGCASLWLLAVAFLPVSGSGGSYQGLPSGVISGRVIDASSGAPIQGATVVVSVDGGRSRLSTAMTGSGGQFSVTNVPASGALVVFASLVGYAGGYYGQTAPAQTQETVPPPMAFT